MGYWASLLDWLDGNQHLKKCLGNGVWPKSWSRVGINLLQRKYVLEFLDEISFLGTRPVDTYIDPSMKFLKDERKSFRKSGKYCLLVGKLNYLTITQLDISYTVRVISQFLDNFRFSH